MECCIFEVYPEFLSFNCKSRSSVRATSSSSSATIIHARRAIDLLKSFIRSPIFLGTDFNH